MKRVTQISALAGCFLAGIATMGWIRSEPTQSHPTVVEIPAPVLAKSEEKPLVPSNLSPAELEVKAEKTVVATESARQFREAGDRYLKEEANLAAALAVTATFWTWLSHPNRRSRKPIRGY